LLIIKNFYLGTGEEMRYHSATSFEEAARLSFQASGVTRFLAGGTDVLVQLRSGAVMPDDLIDIKNISGVYDITNNPDGSWTIGAAVPGAQLGKHSKLSADWPGVVEGMEVVGSTQIQGRATLVGNLCNGSPAADSVPGLIAAGASATITELNGSRDIAIENIPVGPGKTSLEKGEVISAIHIPNRGADAGDAYLRFIPRTEMDIAVVGCAVNLRLSENKISEARVVLGAVAPTAILVPDAADAIVGTSLDEDTIDKLMSVVRQVSKPIDDKRASAEYRTELIGVLAKRAAQLAYSRAKGDSR
jgi:xanthine dehydrogenase FAD-binding subunit